jgi:hypothetical protein
LARIRLAIVSLVIALTPRAGSSVCDPIGVIPFQNVEAGPEGGPFACPCYHFLTLGSRGGFDICQVCFWEDDGQDDHDADRVRGGPNGVLSLTEARANFLRIGAWDERSLTSVRAPRPEEYPAL